MQRKSNPAIIRPYSSSKNLKKNEVSIQPQQQQGLNLTGGNFNIIIQKEDGGYIHPGFSNLGDSNYKQVTQGSSGNLNISELGDFKGGINNFNKLREYEKELEKERAKNKEREMEYEKNKEKEINNIGPKLVIKSKNIKNKDVGIIFNTANSDKNLETSIIATTNNNSSDLSFNISSKERMKLYENGKIELNGNIYIKSDQTVIKGDIIGLDNVLINGNITSNGNLIVCKDTFMENTIINNNLTTNNLVTNNLLIKNTVKENIQELDKSYSIDNISPILYNNTENNNREIGLLINKNDINYNLLAEDNSINYIKLIAILVNEVKNLKKEIKELKNKEINSKEDIFPKEQIALEEINFFDM